MKYQPFRFLLLYKNNQEILSTELSKDSNENKSYFF